MALFPDSFQHIGKREQQQDAFWFSDVKDEAKGALVAVADGMGGMAMGQESAQQCIHTLSEHFATSDIENPVQWLYNTAQNANQKVYQMAVQSGVAGEAGCTLVTVYIKENLLYFLSVGDSHIFVFRDGEIAQVNTEHTYGTYLWREVQAGKISRQEAESHPDRNALTSFIGIPKLSEIDQNYQPIALQDGDLILLCSDGLTNTLSLSEIAAILREHPQKATQQLVDAVLAKELPHQDNVSIATLSYTKEKPANPPPLPQPATTSNTQSTIRQKNSGWKIAGIAAICLLGAWGIWRWMQSPTEIAQPQNMVYIGARQWNEAVELQTQPIRGYFFQENVKEEGQIRWTNVAGSRDTLVQLDLGGNVYPLGNQAMRLQGILRSEPEAVDQLLFTNKENPSIYYLFGWNSQQKTFGADTLKGSFEYFKSSGVFYYPNSKSDIQTQRFYPLTSYMKPEEFLPWRSRNKRFLQQESEWNNWLNRFNLRSDETTHRLGLNKMAKTAFLPIVERAETLMKDFPEDKRIKKTTTSLSNDLSHTLYRYNAFPEGWQVSVIEQKDTVWVFNPLPGKGIYNTCGTPKLRRLTDQPSKDLRFKSEANCNDEKVAFVLNLSTQQWK